MLANTKIVGALLAGALLLGTASNAYAVLISGDDAVHGIGSITIDTVNNLEWLDVPLTQGLSFDDAAALTLPGEIFEGFRHATFPEIITLFDAAGLTGSTDAERFIAAQTFLSLFGVTATPADALVMNALYDDSLDPTNTSLLEIGVAFVAVDTSVSKGFDDFFEDSFLTTFSDVNIGNLLVRNAAAVPAPAGIFFIAPAVLLLGAMRKRKQSRRA